MFSSPPFPRPPGSRAVTLMDRSSSPKATMTLMGGSTRLDSWLSTVARMAFCGGRGAGDEWKKLVLNATLPDNGLAGLLTLKSSKSMW